MPAPDLNAPEGARLYRAELARVARPWRYGGLAVAGLAVLLAAWNRNQGGGPFDTSAGQISSGLFLIGATMAVIAIVKRTAYHRRRLAGGDH